MGKTYEEQLTIPVVYENIPKSLVLVSEVPDKLTISVESSGWGILSHYVFDDKTITVNVAEVMTSDYSHVSTKDARILASLGSQLKVIDVYPLEITFTFENVNSKRVPVSADVALSFEQQYEMDGEVVVIPDTISIYGAKNVLDKITEVRAKPFSLKKLNSSFSEKVELKPIKNVDFSTEQVTVAGTVEKFTEQSVSVPIKLLNIPGGITFDLMTDRVTITFLIGMSKVQQYYPSDFEAIADYEKRMPNGTIPVEIVRFPQFVRIINQNPVNDGIITNISDSNE